MWRVRDFREDCETGRNSSEERRICELPGFVWREVVLIACFSFAFPDCG